MKLFGFMRGSVKVPPGVDVTAPVVPFPRVQLQLGPKSCRFLITAVRHYIAELEHFRGVVMDEQHFFDNDISLYKCLLEELQRVESAGRRKRT